MRIVLTNKLYLSLVLFVLASAVYFPSLNNKFLWDDVAVIQKSSNYLNELDIGKILVPGKSNRKDLKYYRPTFQISMFADYQIWGVKPFGYHFTNVLLFSISVLVLFLLSFLILKSFSIPYTEKYSLITSAIFIAHPMHVESVSWIAGRTDILCSIFMGLALIFHILSKNKILYIFGALICFYLSLLSKELAIIFPLIAILFDFLSGRNGKRNIIIYATYLAALFVYVYLRSRAYINIPPVSSEITVSSTEDTTKQVVDYISLIKTFTDAYLFYIYKIVLPFDFSAYIPNVPSSPTYFISSVITIVLLSLLSFLSYLKKRGIIAFSVFWVFITLGPSVMVAVLSIAATPIAERYLFVPTAGFCLLGGYLFYLGENHTPGFKKLSIGVLILILTTFTFFTIKRQAVWQDRLSLWKDTSEKAYYDAFPHNNYGKALQDNKQYEMAIKEYMTALAPEIHDTERGRAITANNLALLYIETGQYENAGKWLKKALEYDPSILLTYYHLGLVNYINGDINNSHESFTEAERLLLKVIKKDRRYAKAKLLLAKVYLSLGENEKAVKYAKESLRRLDDPRLIMEAKKIIKVNNKSGQNEP